MDSQDITKYLRSYRGAGCAAVKVAAAGAAPLRTHVAKFMKGLHANRKPIGIGAAAGTAAVIGGKALEENRSKANAEAAERVNRNASLRTAGFSVGIGSPVVAYLIYKAMQKKNAVVNTETTTKQEESE